MRSAFFMRDQRFFMIAAALWLLVYGTLRLRSAINGYSVSFGHAVSGGLMATPSMAAALTFANPHVYLDTVVLIGTLSLQFSGMAKLAYAVGATTASFLFFSHWRLARGCWRDECSDPVQGECLTVRLRY